MRSKKVIIGELKEAVVAGVVTRYDVDRVFESVGEASLSTRDLGEWNEPRKNSIIRSLFYAAGVILFAAVVSVINQTWENNLILHIFLTVFLGGVIWAVAYLFGRDRMASDIRHGVSDALILTGSLLLVAGGYIIINHFGSYGRVDFFEAVPALAVLAALHFGFFKILKRDIVYLIGMLLSVASVGALVYGILEDSDTGLNVWALTFIALAGLLVWATHVVSRYFKSAEHLQGSHDKLAIFLSLFTMFIASLGDWAGFWYLLLAISICAVYYLSIIRKQKILLGAASTFLVLTTVTVAFRYFSAFSLTASLIVSAAGILLVAALATQLNKRYLND